MAERRRYRWLTEGETYLFQMDARKTAVPERRGQRVALLTLSAPRAAFPGSRNVLIRFPDGLIMITVPGVLRPLPKEPPMHTIAPKVRP
ncbi:hypothetical protein [Deinococcus multiflagellatus]|uniref:hypothetical protein n=1 Tax=Deinococcus multiflagellatus TaxID=1656887 RepID=UPI001CCFE9B6|nr:hypothetical protein [Deinococcus multiflagellatus]MBZ9715513.1 hypothetical protein [Deinococcus multiflagellatus]